MLDAIDDPPDTLLGRKLEDGRDGIPGAFDLAEADPCAARSQRLPAASPNAHSGLLVSSEAHGRRGVVLGLPGFSWQPGERVGGVVQLPGPANVQMPPSSSSSSPRTFSQASSACSIARRVAGTLPSAAQVAPR